MTLDLIAVLHGRAAKNMEYEKESSSETLKAFYRDEARLFENIAARLAALTRLYLAAKDEANEVIEELKELESLTSGDEEIAKQQVRVVDAAGNWVDAIEDHPNSWADAEDWALINAVKAYRGEKVNEWP